MAGINNIIGAYNINPKRISSKLSFEVGQVFAAKVVATGELNKELILRLLDGWQFPAKLEKPLDFIPEGLIKLQVDGFQDGKLLIKLVNPNKDENKVDKDSLEDLLLQSKIDVDKDDYDILKNMIKHNMPLTKDNISKVKTIFDFRDKLFNDDGEADSFISKYINSKDLEVDSAKGKEVKEILKGFFKELKNVSEDEILTMLENNIDLTEDNIKSFNKLNTETSTIYKDLKAIGKQLNVDLKPETMDIESLLSKINESPSLKEEASKIFSSLEEKLENKSLNPKELQLYEGFKKLLTEEGQGEKNIIYNNYNKKEAKQEENEEFKLISPKSIEQEASNKSDKNNIQTTEQKNVDNKESHNQTVLKDSKHNVNLNKNELEGVLKEQLSSKTEEMKNIIRALLDKTEKSKSEASDKIIQTLKDNINDFKVFNSISNQYYCLDVPVNINKEDYNCKLLIKDDRKSGKKIDSKNVSMVVSVKTVNIGIIDAYIKLKEHNMSIDIKCEESWIKLLTSGKNNVMSELNKLGYNVFFNVEKREQEANLTNCRDFFDDNNLNSINVKV